MRVLSTLRGRRCHERGGLAVEFAFTLPLLLALIFGTVDVGRLVMSQSMLSYAVAVGARTGAATNAATFTTVQTAVQNSAKMLNISSGNIHYKVNGVVDTGFAGRTAGNTFTVYTTYSFQPVFIKQLRSRTLNASTTVTIQ